LTHTLDEWFRQGNRGEALAPWPSARWVTRFPLGFDPTSVDEPRLLSGVARLVL